MFVVSVFYFRKFLTFPIKTEHMRVNVSNILQEWPDLWMESWSFFVRYANKEEERPCI
jgi:hypothetical protein